jgi:hypothetical protein
MLEAAGRDIDVNLADIYNNDRVETRTALKNALAC